MCRNATSPSPTTSECQPSTPGDDYLQQPSSCSGRQPQPQATSHNNNHNHDHNYKQHLDAPRAPSNLTSKQPRVNRAESEQPATPQSQQTDTGMGNAMGCAASSEVPERKGRVQAARKVGHHAKKLTSTQRTHQQRTAKHDDDDDDDDYSSSNDYSSS